VTNHFAGSLDTTAMTPFQDVLDYQLLQSGHAGTLSNQANQLSQVMMRARTMPGQLAPKAVINGETIYDGGPAPCNLCSTGCACLKNVTVCSESCSPTFSPNSARQTAYLSLLSGASGYSLGARGVFDWGIFGSASTGWTKSSSDQMKYLRDFFVNAANINWTNLTPDPTRILNQAGPEQQKMVLARDGFQAIVAYLPDNLNIKINVDGFAGFSTNRTTTAATWSMKWFNPRSGGYQSLTSGQWSCAVQSSKLNCTFWPPATGDWVLLLKRGTIVTSPPPVANTLQTWADVDTDGLPVVYAQFYDGDGAEVGSSIQVSDIGDTSLKGRPRLVREPVDGGYLVVWESAEDEGASSAVLARAFDADGEPLSDPFVVSPETSEDYSSPAVAATPDGGFVVAWAGRDLAAGTTEILARTYDSTGMPVLRHPVQVASGSQVTFAVPQVATDSSGNIAIAWESTAAEDATTVVEVRKLSSAGVALADTFVAGPPVIAGMANHLDQSSLLPTGDIQITWEANDNLGNSQGLFSCPYNSTGTATGDTLMIYDPNAGAGDS